MISLWCLCLEHLAEESANLLKMSEFIVEASGIFITPSIPF